MKRIKLFEDFFKNSEAGAIKFEDVLKCIEMKGKIYATIVKEIPKNDPEEALIPTSIDDDGLVTVEQDGKIGYVELADIEKMEF